MDDWAQDLIAWFRHGHRAMPWRDDPAPYAVWVSEVMLQQTQVATVIPYFRRFMRRFPTLADLARAPLRDVLKTWQGLGYYARARNLHAAARLVRRAGGRIPLTEQGLRALPGVGAYTAAAVASIAGGEPVPALDGNVLRVCARIWALEADVRAGRTRTLIRDRLLRAMPPGAASAFNQGLMELGALVCKPGRPRCASCPVAGFCAARAAGRAADLPATRPRKQAPHIRAAVAVIWRDGRVLIARRRADQMLGGLWEFPGGKRKRGESAAAAAAREVLEETGLAVRVGRRYGTVRHAYSHFRVTLDVLRCAPLPGGRARARSAERLEWVPFGQVARHPLPRATEKILDLVARSEKQPLRPARGLCRA